MTLVKYDPWNILDQMRKDIERASMTTQNEEGSSVATADWAPAVDIQENETAFILHADIPGVNPENIEVHMENGMLTIRGERQSESKDEKKGYKRVERVYGSFYRRFALPDSADAEKISAKSEHGVLEITIPKQEQQQPRRITVN